MNVAGPVRAQWPGALMLLAMALPGARGSLAAQATGTGAPDFPAPYVSDTGAPPWRFWAREAAPLTILSFWATWCKPCETLHPWMEALARSYASRGVRVVTVNMREPADSIRRLLATDSGSVTLDVLDADGRITELYAVTSVPTTVLVAQDNVVVQRWEGIAAAMSGIEPVVNRLLGPAPAASHPPGWAD